MKKLDYMSPVVEVLEIKAQELLAGSVTDEGNVIIGDPVPGDAGGAAAPELDPSNPLKILWTIVLLVMMSLAAAAQTVFTVEPADMPADGKTHGMKLYLKDNTTVEYPLSAIEHVTYLPGVGMKVYLKGETYSFDYLFSQMTKIDYFVDGNANANWKKYGWTDYKEAWRLEYPQLSDNVSTTGSTTNSQVVVKSTTDYGITYSLEWDNAKIANRWTCYELHEGNSMSQTGRHDDFKADPEVAVSSQLANYSNSGFSRGHLCPSADRQCSVDQNKQTFFLTNMQPQYQNHNGGLWSNLETLVRDYATDDSKTQGHCDTLYIVKAATITDKVTINDAQVDGIYAEKCNGKLIVPKYFYMALLHYNKATDTYHALAFWTEHTNVGDKNKNYGDYVITIDELEKRTGIDFFCNLPDEIENDVESKVSLGFWKLTTTNP